LTALIQRWLLIIDHAHALRTVSTKNTDLKVI